MIKDVFENKVAKKVILTLSGLILIGVMAIVVLSVLLSSNCAKKNNLLIENNSLLKENNSILKDINGSNEETNPMEETSDEISTSSQSDETEDDNTFGDTTTNEATTSEEDKTSDTTEQTTTEAETTTNNNAQTTVTSNLPYGKLSVNSEGILVGENGKVATLKGVSTHGIAWFPDYINADAVKYCKEQLGANLFRVAMYTAEYNGYCEGGDQNQLRQLVHNGVKYATDNNMYVIIDWHVLNDNNPNKYIDQAKIFFEDMSATYADYDNVIYEICNEPCGGVTWTEVKNYALQIIPIIRANDSDAIIIVGTPNWSQDVDIVANDRITGYDNIMYAFHFYATTHGQDYRNKVQTALNSNLPIFVSEFGICEASGNGWINEDEANTWISFLEDNDISYCMWNLCNKNEASAMINSWNTSTTWWNYDDLSQAGKWLARTYGGAIAEGR